MPRITLVIPCYNEAERLDTARFTSFTLPGHEFRFLFVDDGSRDATFEVLERMRQAAPETIRVLRQERNGGKPAAVRAGFLHALSPPEGEPVPDAIGFWDADLATPLPELIDFWNVLERNPHVDIVMGARVKLLGRNIDRKAMRHYFGRVFATAVSMTLSLPVYDTQCGAKLFRTTDCLRTVFAQPFRTRWIFDVEILARAMAFYGPRGTSMLQRVVELPLQQWRDVAGSKVRFTAGLKAFLDLASIWQREVRPVRKALP